MLKPPGLGYFVTVALEKPHRFHTLQTTDAQFNPWLSVIWTLPSVEPEVMLTVERTLYIWARILPFPLKATSKKTVVSQPR